MMSGRGDKSGKKRAWDGAWSTTWTLVVVLSMVLGPLSLAGTPAAASGPSTPDAPAATGAMDRFVYLPLVLRNVAASPGDALVVSWAQTTEGGARTVLLQWREPNTTSLAVTTVNGGSYAVSRRVEGQASWQLLGNTQPAATATAMLAILGQELADQLAWDLRLDADGDPLTLQQVFDRLRTDPAVAQLLAGQYYQVGLAMGMAYLDPTAPAGVTLEYKVVSLMGRVDLAPARIPSATSSLPTPTGLRAVWTGPHTLGARPSDRPDTAEERFEWIGAQAYRPWDGTVYLIWDLPAQGAGNGGTLDDGLSALNLAGYRVYRAVHGTQAWRKVNPSKADCLVPSSPYCEILTGAMMPAETDDGFPQFFFKEDLHEVLSDPAQLYAQWDYKVCPVDGLRREGTCSAALPVVVRELMSPKAANDLIVAADATQTQLQLTWVYSDATEVSLPLRFYVTRSPSLTLPLEAWTPITPTNAAVPYQQVGATGPIKLTITDVPPKDEVYWYRVQVRDSAGNWSAPGQAVKGALYTRTDPAFADIPYDAGNCAANAMPLTLNGLSSKVRQIAVYRGFSTSGPWHLIKRVTVTDGSATISDAYVPPYAVDVYYHLEAVDGHGNVSAAQEYCTHLEGSTILPPPPPATTTVTLNDNVYVWEIESGDAGTPDDAPPTEVDVTMPGEDGPITVTVALTETASGEMLPGAWIEIDGSTTGSGGTGASSESWVRVTNDFIDTDRQMTDLGALHSVQWMVSQSEPPYVRVVIAAVDEWSPPLALFRRIPGGSWLQVTEVRGVQPHVIEDHSDPSPYQAYEYAVLLFSPTTYEVLGYWGPTTLAALYPAQVLSLSGTSITPVPPFGVCTLTQHTAADVGMQSTIDLANGWVLTDVIYYTSSGRDCPPSTFDPTHAYGRGTLTLARGVTRAVYFYDVGVTTRGAHVSGKIVAALNYNATAVGYFPRRFGQIEFTAGTTWQAARAEVTVTLPSNIRIRTAVGDANRVYGVFDNVTSGFAFDSGYPAGTIIDENLPWRLTTPAEIGIDERAVEFGLTVTTEDRLDYGPGATDLEPGDPDNNLGFMRSAYTSSDAVILTTGLNGTFGTNDNLSYATSLPAAVEVHARGAELTIAGSRIQRGLLHDASARLIYFDRGTNIDLAAYNSRCDGTALDHYSLCEWTFGALHARTLTMTVTMPGNVLAIGADGLMTATVMLDAPAGWPSFEVASREATLYLAGATPGGSVTTTAPLPAENAWRQLDHAATGGRLDPGINLNADDAEVLYGFYTPPEFEPSSMDLYIRRGGVSGHLIMGGGGARENAYGYSEEVQRIELLIIDNGTVSPPLAFETDLYLPYPTDAMLQLDVWQISPSSNLPVSGGFRQATTVLHKYWNFTETPAAWQYSPVGGDYGSALSALQAVFTLTNGRAMVTGLSSLGAQPGTANVTLALASEWLPDGDIGAVRLYAPPTLEYRVSGFTYTFSGLRLSRYNSTPLVAGSLPETLGIDMGDNLSSLPAKLLSSGALTPASLQACASGDTVGCGFVVIDGNVAVDYFGEVRDASTTALVASDTPIVDELVGMVPIAVNTLESAVHELMVKAAELPWSWPVVNDVLDIDLPVKFLGNTEGGVLAGVYREATVFPDQELFSTDVAAVISARWGGPSSGTEDKLGIFLGYPASQAAFRALAMNRPDPAGGVLPYDRWDDIESDIRIWSAKFGYTEAAGAANDPVDLAHDLWNSWCTAWSGDDCTAPREFDKVYDVVEPVLRDLAGHEAYGVAGLEPGPALATSGATMNNGALVATFHRDGLGLQLSALKGGTQMGYDIYGLDLWVTDVDVFVRMDWITAEMNRDGEVLFYGEPYLNLIGDYGVDGEFFGMAFPDSLTAWRVEATVDLDTIGIAGVSGLDLAGEFGSGPFNGEDVSYLGVRGEGYYFDYRVGGGLLYGSIYDSPILRNVGYGELLDTLGDENTYTGIYLYLNGDFPIVEGASCLLKASAAGELRFWYYWSDDVYGGTLTGAAHATVACVISGRGQMELGYARLDQGGTQWGQTCTSPTCDAYGGAFWVAVGVGWCSPSSWRRWESRWWGDDWCYTFGAYVDLSYLDPGGLDYSFDLDFE